MKKSPLAHLMLFILAYDTYAMVSRKDTITANFRDSFTVSPLLTSAGTAYILAHLFNYPRHFRRVDLFNGYALLFGYVGKRFNRIERQLDRSW